MIISSFVEATLHITDNTLTLAANWVLAIRDMEENVDKIFHPI